MLFDRQLLYLAFVFGTKQVSALAIPFSPSAVEIVSVEIPAGPSTSAASEARFPSLHINDVVSLSIFSSDGTWHQHTRISDDSTSPQKAAHSVSDIALPSRATQSLNKFDYYTHHAKIKLDLHKRTVQENNSTASATGTGLVTAATAKTTTMTTSGGLLQSLEGIFNTVVSEVVGDGSTTGLTTSVSQTAIPSTSNAIGILLSALPSNVRSEVNHFTNGIEGGTQTNRHRPTNHPTGNRHHSPSHHRPTTHHTTAHTTTKSTSIHTTTSATGPPSRPTGALGEHPLPIAATAGIASGLAAGAVIVAIAGVFLWRRRKQGKPLFGRSASQRSGGSGRAYPEVAWLYDPKISPPGSPGRSRAGSGAEEAALIPQPRPASVEMGEGSANSNLRPARPSSPLLAPHMPPSRDESPGGSPGSSEGRSRSSRGASQDNLRVPLRPINEE